ncbi:succinyl-diaminopimelate desuccinylase [Aurantimicrobium sp. INA4]|uniref:succinyl-diaminopimelate desuccinylase n=1 Tax=Aurantimicrobium sp. INA4 TaxID=2986279 RepID=UPI0024901316|nr:succinyl-diaminopimelate desuccinylase [Aurantimicrobium sp. INA4]BDU10541.1 succinyl-diaminopimelate desuccinylase [Aurantimicrobium sp. INA4]
MSSTPTLDLFRSSVELTADICNIESVSGNEHALANAIEAALSEYAHLDIFRNEDAVVARTNLGRSQRVIIAGHIDTVPVNNNLPVRYSEEEGAQWLWGRGTVDMKAGVAVAVKLAAELTEPAYDITWIWYDHEEVESSLNGLGRLAVVAPELLTGDFAILGEPSNSTVEGGCNGTLRVEVRTHGVRAHSARAWMGENAIHKLAPALAALEGYKPATVTVDGLDYREGLSAVGISGGVAGNVIPDAAVLTVNYRFAPDKSVDQALVHVQDVFAGFEIVVIDSAEGARPGLTAAIAQDFVAAVGEEPKPKYGWTDVSRFSALGIPAVNFGPGDPSLAHTDDERVLTSQIESCEQALRTWLTQA